MGTFIDYLSNPFQNIANTPAIILTAATHTLLVNGLIVCNRGERPIRFFLQKARMESPPTGSIFLINQFLIDPYQTVDVVAKIGLQIVLQYSATPNLLIDSLICFTGGKTQKIDCDISYTMLNDLPLS